MDSRIWTVLPAVIAGILIGATLMQVATPVQSGTSVPSHGLSTATGCVDGDDPRGWVGVVPNADYRAVYLQNYSYGHESPDVEILGDLTESAPNVWVFAITVTHVASGKAATNDCEPRSLINAEIALPTSAESLTITIDGENVTVLETATQAPRFRYLEE